MKNIIFHASKTDFHVINYALSNRCPDEDILNSPDALHYVYFYPDRDFGHCPSACLAVYRYSSGQFSTGFEAGDSEHLKAIKAKLYEIYSDFTS